MTYCIQSNKIQGMVTGTAALRQSLEKLLSVGRYEYEIYDFDYGVDLKSLIGKDREYVEVEAKRRIRETVMSDDRVTGVNDIAVEYGGDIMAVEADISSIYGDMVVRTEVNGV